MGLTLSCLTALVVAAYWSQPTAERRRDVLLAATLGLVWYLSWQQLPADFLAKRGPLVRGVAGAALAGADVALVALTVWAINASASGNARLRRAWLVALLALFVVYKWTWLQQAGLQLAGRKAKGFSLAGAWLGLSYLLFRLIHMLLEAGKGRLKQVAYRDALVYALFPAAFLSGPIDRFPRFKSDLDKAGAEFKPEVLAQGGWRIAVGMFKKFVLAEYLAGLTLSLEKYPDGTPLLALWGVLYLYGFLLYFDFSGYTDIAIGAGRLLGFALPENFDSPYGKPNLARFWQSWHITLSFWLRDYVFLPLGQNLRRRAPGLSLNAAVLVCHLATMVLIGLWHAFGWPFVLWGVWHALGLWIVKLWNDFTKANAGRLAMWKNVSQLTHGLAVFLTFQYVMLGWIFFVAPDVGTALRNLARMFGASWS